MGCYVSRFYLLFCDLYILDLYTYICVCIIRYTRAIKYVEPDVKVNMRVTLGNAFIIVSFNNLIISLIIN